MNEPLHAALEEALRLAQSNYCSDEDLGGMADVRLLWNPYECRWEAHATWSSDRSVKAWADTPQTAVENLVELLAAKAEPLPEKERPETPEGP